MALLATTEEAMALEANIIPSRVASVENRLAFSILEAPLNNLISDSSSSFIIFCPHTIEALATIDVVAQALIVKADASWLCISAISIDFLVLGIPNGPLTIFRQEAW